MATVEMSFTPLPVHVRTARLVATAVARRSGVDEALLDEVRLAVGEACSRAVEAHQAQCPAEPVHIELTGSAGRFEVVVTDAAAASLDGADGAAGEPPGWHPLANGAPNGTPAAPSAEPASPRAAGAVPPGPPPGLPGLPGQAGTVPPYGLGLAVIAGLADDVQFSRTAAGLSIRMSWPAAGRAG